MGWNFLGSNKATGLAGATVQLDTRTATLLLFWIPRNSGSTVTIADSVGGNNNGAPTVKTIRTNSVDTEGRWAYWYNPVNVGIAHDFTAGAGAVACVPTILAFSHSNGAFAGDPFDTGQDQGNSTGSNDQHLACSSALTPSAAGALIVIGGCFVDSTGAAASGFTNRELTAFAGGNNYGSCTAYLAEAPASANTPQWDTTNGTHMVISGLVFLAPAGASGPTYPQLERGLNRGMTRGLAN